MGDKMKNFLSKSSNLLDKVKSGMNKNATNPVDTPFENMVNSNLDGIQLPATPVTFPKWVMFIGVGFLILFFLKVFKKKPTFRRKKKTATNYTYSTRGSNYTRLRKKRRKTQRPRRSKKSRR